MKLEDIVEQSDLAVDVVAKAICRAVREEPMCGTSSDREEDPPENYKSCVSCRNAARTVLQALGNRLQE